jgi:hypothetical protein
MVKQIYEWGIALLVSVLAGVGVITLTIALLKPAYLQQVMEDPFFVREDTMYIEPLNPTQVEVDSLTGIITKTIEENE